MSIKIGLLGFGTVASGIPFLLKENGEKVLAASRDQLEIAKVLVKDDEEKNRLIAAGNDYNFVTNVDEILNDDEIQIVVELMGRIEPARTFITKALEAGKNVVSANKDLIATHGKNLRVFSIHLRLNNVRLYLLHNITELSNHIPLMFLLINTSRRCHPMIYFLI